MSAEAHRSVNGDTGETPEEAALARVLESYLAGLEAGCPADPDRLIAAHPELAGPLRACLKVMHLAAGLSNASSPVPADAGITAPPGTSALTVLWPSDDPSSHLLLPEPPEDDALVVRIGTDALTDLPEGAGAGRYQVLGEIARGGMGVVLRARDVDLGRDLALKVLQTRHRGDADVVSRFVEEARIGGQLQHPGIVPVHELGTLADRRPYFTMKLVKGRTLAALLAERSGPEADLPRFLTIFEQICQTVAYAHARRVIHRDLKPANVMVGSFGEVQVVDWGLAKVLPEGGVADEAKALEREETVVQTARSGPAGSDGESQPGSVLGTPSYMAPEQARGDIDQVDERADVFGLGAILCEVLTGRPPFGGSSRNEIRDRAARGDLAVALRRLDTCGADAELIGLARNCVAAEPEQRPRNAAEVARWMSAYQAGVQERLRAAELARAKAQARAEEEGRRRRVTVALAASVLGLVVLGGGGWAYLARQRAERARQVDRASSGLESLYTEAMRAGDDLTRWAAAREAAHALEGSLADVRDEVTRHRLAARIRDVARAAVAAEDDQKLFADLVGIRSAIGEAPDGTATDAAYADAFHGAGLDVATAPPAEIGAMIRDRPATVRLALTAALDDWTAVRRDFCRDAAGARRLAEIAGLADPDPWRNRLRETVQLIDREQRIAALKDLSKSARIDELPAVSLSLLGGLLLDTGDPEGGEAILREAVRRYPGDLWINYDLALRLERSGRREESIRFFFASRSIRPMVAHQLGHALEQKGETAQAITILEDLARLSPENAWHRACLGKMFLDCGRTREAEQVLDRAISLLRAEIGQRPDRFDAYLKLGSALVHRGNPSEAILVLGDALRLKPNYPEAHNNLGIALREQGKLDEAIAELRDALRLKPDYPEAHNNLGNSLRDKGKLEEAIAEHRTALRLNPDYALAHNNLGNSLHDKGKLEEAIAEYRTALRLNPAFSEAHNNLGTALRDQEKLDEAIVEYRAALHLKSDLAEAHLGLGNALRDKGKLEEAIAEYRTALRLKPNLARAHNNLGIALRGQGKLEEAIAEYRAALRPNPDYALAHTNLGVALHDKGKLEEAIAEHRAALRLNPAFSEAHNNLGVVLRSRGEYSEAVAEFHKARDLAKATNPRLVQPVEANLTETERLASLAGRLPAILAGQIKPADAAESLTVAVMCYERKLHGASARFWSEAYQAMPNLMEDMQAQHRYNAACAAALAGCGQGKDEPPLDDAARARWRKQAIAWLKADLAAWSKILESAPPQARPSIAQTLQHWKADPDLAGLRDPGSLAKLPKGEQDVCRALWKDVDALLARAGVNTR